MNIIVYGSEKPKINFRQSPEGSLAFDFDDVKTLTFSESQRTITWKDMLEFPFWLIGNKNTADLTREFEQFVEKFADIITSNAERQFFNRYTQTCVTFAMLGDAIGSDFNIWDYPALIPQVWVNWIHYDPKDSRRAERALKEPFRVDFMMRDEEIDEDFIIFEIDGTSHFKDMETYTQHLQKDRWLRSQGWKVYRISNLEVEQCADFVEFYGEITGKYMRIPDVKE